jgi:hypothetical protein
MRLRHAYLGLCLVGIVLPYWALVPWFMENGFDLRLFGQELFATRVGAFFGLDVLVSAIVLFLFVFAEGRRVMIPHLWMPILATLLVGVSLGFPLFLYLRQRKLDDSASRGALT